MAIKDNVSPIEFSLAHLLPSAGSSGVISGHKIDTKDFDFGLGFTYYVENHSGGTMEIGFQESINTTEANFSDIPIDKIIGNPVILDASSVANYPLYKNGIISNKRYVRTSVTITTFTGTLWIYAIKRMKKLMFLMQIIS